VAAEKGLFTLLFNLQVQTQICFYFNMFEHSLGLNRLILLQVPGSTHYSMVLYFVAKRPIPPDSLLQRFIDGDDGFRNSRLKLIPSVPKVIINNLSHPAILVPSPDKHNDLGYILQGTWIVRQSVGSTPCMIGKAVDCNYFRGEKYLEVHSIFPFHSL
jgi:hypothetical protein